MSDPRGAASTLRAIPFFSRLPDTALCMLEAGVRVEQHRRGETLCRPGRLAEAFSIVRAGRVRVSAPGASRGAGDGEWGRPGAWFGADTVLLGPPDRRTIVVVEDAELATIPRACIDDLLRTSLSEVLGGPPVAPPAAGRGREGAGPAPSLVADRNGRSRSRVGLALSGGGAKAFAHLGVLKALSGAGIPLDVVAGTSAGAIAAAMYCAGKTLPEMFAFADQLRQRVLRREGMWDFFDSPTVGLIRGERTRALYDQVLDGKGFEDLLKPLAVPTADIVTGEAVVMRTGSISDAVRASAGIPGLYAPWPHAGRYLIEGGLVNPLPVDLAREQGADLVISCQVISSPAEIRAEPLDVPSANLLGLIAARANAILARHVGERFQEAEVLIRPEVDDYDLLDYPMAEELIALGEAAAEERLPQIRELLERPARLASQRFRPARAVPGGPPARSLLDG